MKAPHPAPRGAPTSSTPPSANPESPSPTAQPATQAGLKPGLRERGCQGSLLTDSWDPWSSSWKSWPGEAVFWMVLPSAVEGRSIVNLAFQAGFSLSQPAFCLVPGRASLWLRCWGVKEDASPPSWQARTAIPGISPWMTNVCCKLNMPHAELSLPPPCPPNLLLSRLPPFSAVVLSTFQKPRSHPPFLSLTYSCAPLSRLSSSLFR